MLHKITGSVKDYDWGSKTLVSDYFHLPNQQQKIAEIWFGTHPGGEAKIQSSSENLSVALNQKLSFLAKFLSAEKPLSIQVHPTTEQARIGYQKEQSLGIAISDPKRNYKDESSKPEILISLTNFHALCGFRPIADLTKLFLELSASDSRFETIAKSLEKEQDLEKAFSALVQDFELARDFEKRLSDASLSPASKKSVDLALSLLKDFPSDPGVLVALLLNEVTLEPGEAIFLPAGNVHAYLSGLGVEVMKASDNVVRGGLTSKHVDVSELLSLVDFSPLPDPKVLPTKLAEGLYEYRVAESGFRVYRACPSAKTLLVDLDLIGVGLALCTSGEVAISTSLEEREVIQASEALVFSAAKKFSVAGSGEVFLVFGS